MDRKLIRSLLLLSVAAVFVAGQTKSQQQYQPVPPAGPRDSEMIFQGQPIVPEITTATPAPRYGRSVTLVPASTVII